LNGLRPEGLRWLSQDELPLAADDPRRGWLGEPGSLTAKLKEERPGAFRLELIAQVAEPLSAEFADLLDAAPGSPGHRREVKLYAGGSPCIFACSVWPEVTERDQAWLDDLGERPLGDALFAHPAARRSPIDVARTVESGSSDGEAIWARRSVFRLGDTAPLLVHEFFLPGLFPGYRSCSIGPTRTGC
jgi:chorismate-pyruvate lyase